MELKSGVLLVPPTVKNSSCSNSRYANHNFIVHIGFAETIEALLILVLTLGVIGANALVIFVINNRRYTAYIHQQPRYLITSLALNDLTIGLLIMPFGLLPALIHCWPYGEIFCQIQGLLRGALSQQSAVILVCMAVDRYMCALHPRKYYQHSSKKGCVAILSLTWIVSLTVFGLLVLPKGYYFNNTGLMACEPFYSKPSYRILATCALYFPTTMVLMYCYGSSFHVSRYGLNDPTQPLCGIHHPHQALASATALPNAPVMNLSLAMSLGMGGFSGPANMVTKKIVPIHEKQSNGATSRSMAAISLGFIVMVTPWTIQEIVTACTGSKLPPFLDFLVTWTALGNSFWNPFVYWVLNPNFRRLIRHLLPNRCFAAVEPPEERKSPCCHLNLSSDCDITSVPMPPEPPASRPPPGSSSIGGSVLGICGRSRPNSLRRSASQHVRSGASQQLSGDCGSYCAGAGYGCMRPDIERLSEKYWGEILERTVSSGNLHALQQTFPHQHHHHHHLQRQHQHQHNHQQQHHHYLQQRHQQPPQNQHQLQHLTQQHQHHFQHAGGATAQPTAAAATMTTSFSKNSDVDDGTGNMSPEQAACDRETCSRLLDVNQPPRLPALLGKFSNSEPRLCEHFFQHDDNCARSKCAACGVLSGGSSSIMDASGGGSNEVSAKAAASSSRNIPDI